MKTARATDASGVTILLFWFHDDWGQFGRTYECVAKHLAELPEVRHVVTVFPPELAGQSGPCWVRRVSDKLTLVNQVLSLRDETGIVGRLRRLWLEREFKKVLRSKGFRRDTTVLWLFPPHQYVEDIIKMVPHRMVVTQIVDDFTRFDPAFWLYDIAKRQYPRVPLFSDLIIASSQQNYDLFSEGSTPCLMFENGVDERFFGQPAAPPHQRNGARPRIGYVGWLTERTDLDLLEFVATQRPDWSLVLVGPQYGVDLYMRGLLTFPNVHYVDFIPNSELPDFLSKLDVCLIPHRDTDYTRSMSPLKLYQYLASGRPIVSTKVSGVERFAEYLTMTSDRFEFVQGIENTLNCDTAEQSARRIAAARNETWDKRIRVMFDAVVSRLYEINS
ncbi:MAG: hypothetical protein FD174_172 [Geobacteraceae bacterium]|nr:MAG: hypothetical protein FD174_172 [Geobacteraceae bacterium]